MLRCLDARSLLADCYRIERMASRRFPLLHRPACPFSDQLKRERVAPRDARVSHEEGEFSEEQVAGILHEASREPTAQVTKKHGTSGQMINIWRQRLSGMNADEVKRRRLEQENARRKKLQADLPLVFGWCISPLDRGQGQSPLLSIRSAGRRWG